MALRTPNSHRFSRILFSKLNIRTKNENTIPIAATISKASSIKSLAVSVLLTSARRFRTEILSLATTVLKSSMSIRSSISETPSRSLISKEPLGISVPPRDRKERPDAASTCTVIASNMSMDIIRGAFEVTKRIMEGNAGNFFRKATVESSVNGGKHVICNTYVVLKGKTEYRLEMN